MSNETTFDVFDLSNAVTGDALPSVADTGGELTPFEYSRPLAEYPAATEIAMFLQRRDKARHIYTRDLNVNGRAVQEAMDKYLAAGDFYPSSALKEALKSPLHLYYYKESGWREALEKYQRNKEYFDLGTFLHQSILEPTKFSRAIVEPGLPMNTKEGVSGLISFWTDKVSEAENAKELLTQADNEVMSLGLDMNKIDGMRAKYKALKAVSGLSSVTAEHKAIIDIVKFNYDRYGDGMFYELLKHSKREISLYYCDPETGLKLRIRPDAMQFAENIGTDTIISVKSTRQDDLQAFYNDTVRLNYGLSEGMYLDVASKVTGRDFRSTIMIMLQTTPPYGVAALVWSAEDLEIGKYRYRQALQTVAECKDSGLYPAYDAFAQSGNMGLIDMKQPGWNAKDLLPQDIEN